MVLRPDSVSRSNLTRLPDDTHWIHHPRQDYPGGMICPTQRPLLDNTHPWRWWDLKPQSQQVSRRRSTPHASYSQLKSICRPSARNKIIKTFQLLFIKRGVSRQLASNRLGKNTDTQNDKGNNSRRTHGNTKETIIHTQKAEHKNYVTDASKRITLKVQDRYEI